MQKKAMWVGGVMLMRPAAPTPPLETDAASDGAAPTDCTPAADPDPIPSADSAQSHEPAAPEPPTPTASGDSPQAPVSTEQDEYWTGLEKLKAASPAHIPGGGRPDARRRTHAEPAPVAPVPETPKPAPGPAFGVGLFGDEAPADEPVAEPVAERVAEPVAEPDAGVY